MQQTAAENLQTGTHPGSVGAGRTRRFYMVTGDEKTVVIRMPSSVAYFGIHRCASAVRVEVRNPIAATALTGIALDTAKAVSLAAATVLPAGPIEPGELVIVRHEDDATDVGVLELELEGYQLPAALETEGTA